MTELTVHDVTNVTIAPMESTGTCWTTFTVYTGDGQAVELTVFHRGKLSITTLGSSDK